jgi:hypothetical protein
MTRAGAGQAEATFDVLDASCKQRFAQGASSGAITVKDVVHDLTTPARSQVTGTYKLVFAGGNVTGDFDASLCDSTHSDAGVTMASNAGGSDGGITEGACIP